MRTIKFRALKDDMSNCAFVYGNLIYGDDGSPRIQENKGDMLFHTCIKGTEGQFTGLTDKNGKEIYEGDIIKSTFEGKESTKTIIGVVEEDSCNPCFVIHYKFNGNGHDCYEYDFIQCGLRTNEVVGNIHQNKEILK